MWTYTPTPDQKRIYFSRLDSRYPLSARTTENYPFLAFEDMLACVELSISPGPPRSTEVSTAIDLQNPQRATIWGLSDDKSVNSAQSHLQEVFAWLRKKGVTSIVKVVVRDNRNRPCSDEVVEKALKGFDIRYLDWDKLDMCCETINSVAPRAVELSLNASGNNAVLWSWSVEGGLSIFKKVHL